MKNKGTRWLTALLAAALLLTAVPCAYAQGAPALQEMEVTAKRLKVRHHPEADDVPVVTELKRGDRVTLLGISGKWSYVKWGKGGHDEQGYVFSRHIKPAGALLYFATEEVNVRSEANSSSRILGVLQAGEAMTFIKKAKGWIQVEYNGASGFVYGKYLTKNRAKSYLGSRLAQELGRSNIKAVEYMYGGRVGIHGLQSSADKPVLAVAYGLKTAYRENLMRVMVYENTPRKRRRCRCAAQSLRRRAHRAGIPYISKKGTRFARLTGAMGKEPRIGKSGFISTPSTR